MSEPILTFPGKGLNVTREFDQQPEDTTADCQNVTSRDAIAGRSRGGSRPGLSKYVAGQSLQGSHMIQMLEVIVDPTIEALPQNFETPQDDWIPHPRFPDVLIPPGGAPWQPFDHSQPPAKQGSASLTATGDLEAEGETPGSGPVCTEWHLVVVMKAGFADVFNGTLDMTYCDCADPDSIEIDTVTQGLQFASPSDLADADAFASWLLGVGIGTGNAADMFDSFDRTATGGC